MFVRYQIYVLNIKPDYLIWMDTIKKGRFEDTNQMFIPRNYNVEVTEKNADFGLKKSSKT